MFMEFVGKLCKKVIEEFTKQQILQIKLHRDLSKVVLPSTITATWYVTKKATTKPTSQP